MGAWIEIAKGIVFEDVDIVAPLVGAWIEICRSDKLSPSSVRSLPSWERGLKYEPIFDKERFELSLPSWERGLK